MMDLDAIYKSRRKRDGRNQRKLFFAFFDWIYLFYIVLPLGIFLVYQYMTIWQDRPEWLHMIQLSGIHLVLFVVMTWNALRTYVKKADQLFLARNTNVMEVLIKKGYQRLVASELLKIAAVMVLILPFLTFYLTTPASFLYIVMMVLFNLFYTLYLYSSWRKKRLTALLVVVYMAAGFFYELWLPLSIVSLGLFIYLWMNARYRNKSFNQWLDIEHDKGSRLSSWLFKIASVSMKKEGVEFSKGRSAFQGIMMYRFSKRGRLFKKRSQQNVLLESFMKWFLRQPAYWAYFFQILGINLLLLLINHVMIEVIISIVCCFGVVNILKSLWTRFMKHDFMTLYRWQDTSIAGARDTTQTALLIVYSAILIIAITIQQVPGT